MAQAYVYEDNSTGWRHVTNADFPNSGVTAATYGDSTHVPQVAVNAQGVITSASNVAISGGSGTVTNVSSADSSIVVTNGSTTPSLQLAALSTIATNEAPTADWSNNSKKITSVKDPTAAQDAATKNYVDTTVSGSTSTGYEINYTEITTNANVTDTAENTATALISPGAITFDGSAVMFTFFCAAISMPTAAVTNTLIITLFEGATQIGRLGAYRSLSTATQAFYGATLHYRFTPSAGSHTYKLCAFVSSTTGTPTLQAGSGGTGAVLPAFVRFNKV